MNQPKETWRQEDGEDVGGGRTGERWCDDRESSGNGRVGTGHGQYRVSVLRKSDDVSMRE